MPTFVKKSSPRVRSLFMVKTVFYPSDPGDSSHNNLVFWLYCLAFRLLVPKAGTEPKPMTVKVLSPGPENSL